MSLRDHTGKWKAKAAEMHAKQKQARAERAMAREKIRQEQEAERQRQAEAEKARQDAILAGKIKPISLSIHLNNDEKAYATFSAVRYAEVEKVVQHTTTKSKRKGVVTRAVVGGVLLGPVGALGGAATAGSRGTSKTTQQTVKSTERIDQGELILTNKRVLFIGKNTVSIPYPEVVAHDFDNPKGKRHKLTLKYPTMLANEHYILTGSSAPDAHLYYRGITQTVQRKAQ